MSYGSRLRAAMDAYGPACIGIDPHAALLEQWGLDDSLAGLERFAATCVEAFAGRVAVVKPQSAFFERFGAAGVAVLERTLQDLRHTGTLTLLDVKRGDIGSTAQAYAEAYLDEDAPMAADAVTVSPYLGFGSLDPFLDVAEKNDAGVFVLALTSNPEGPEVQHAAGPDGRTVAGTVLDHLRTLNAAPGGPPLAELAGGAPSAGPGDTSLHGAQRSAWGRAANGTALPMGSFGAVVGATIGETAEDLDIGGPLLVPGYGSQGGTAADLDRLFAGMRDRVVPSTSRAVLAQGPDVSALRDAAASVNVELR